MNKVILMGRLTRDPDVRYSNQGDRQLAVARYTLAVDRRFRRNNDNNEQSADFISCVAFDRQAEFAEKYLRKGTKMVVCGRLQTGSYTNKDGVRVYTTDVVVEDQEFAESKASASSYNGGGAQDGFGGSQSYGGGQNYGGGQSYGGYGQQGNSRPSPASAIGDDFMNIPDGVDDEGLPFN
ncbi:MAG: single-stranded DNA-binding protein [Lachnospiraceae bacterium]|nr:single-stranded DNA-binding protein [Lachnospiraceae bacterium]